MDFGESYLNVMHRGWFDKGVPSFDASKIGIVGSELIKDCLVAFNARDINVGQLDESFVAVDAKKHVFLRVC